MENDNNLKTTKSNENDTANFNSKSEKKSNSEKAVSFFKLQYSEMKKYDFFVLIFAILGSFGAAIAMPLFAVIFGGTINQLGPANSIDAYAFLLNMEKQCLNFLYVGLGMWFAGFIMIWLWSFNGRVITRRIKNHYFRLLLLQEQGYFDQTNTYEFATKIQSQIKIIETGVKLFNF